MLIYNYQKDFLGIDEKNLKTLGFSTLKELQEEVGDFADLFVKTPGYIHNFQHVHWIDFINYSDTAEESKVLINVNSQTFKATLTVSSLFLVDNPSSPAYIIHLNNLRPLTKSENEEISSDILDRTPPKAVQETPKTFTSVPEVRPSEETYDILQQAVSQEQKPQKKEFDKPTMKLSETSQKEEIAPDIDELSLDVFEETTSSNEIATTTEATSSKQENRYNYDPHVASKELGLPVDLIEEFIQDFITQAEEFKSDIYRSIEDGNVENVQTLSHKLKGVAANLRIVDAHEVLSAVSATDDMETIHENLNTFYQIIASLTGKPDLNNEEIDIKDEDVPLKIEIAELADDDFIEINTDEIDTLIQESSKDDIDFSKSQAAQEIGIDEDTFNELFNEFINEGQSILQNIENAIVDNNLETCHNEALKLKSMSENMRFYKFANALEVLIHSSNQAEINQAIEKLKSTLQIISKTGA